MSHTASVRRPASRTRLLALLAAPLCAWSAPAMADDPKVSLGEIAPPSTFLVVGTDDWTRMAEAWDRSSVSMITKDPEFVAMWKAIWASVNAPSNEEDPSGLPLERLFPFKSLLEDAGVKIEELPLPTGATGLALFHRKDLPAEKPKPADNPDDITMPPSAPPGVLLCGDFGERAGEVEAFIEKAVEELVRRGEAKSTEGTYAGATLRTVELPKLEERWKVEQEEAAKKADEAFRKRAGDQMDEDDLKRFGPGAYLRGQPVPAELRAISTMHFARKGSAVIVGNEKAVVEGALDHLDGKRIDSIGDRPSFADARRWLGEGAHAYAIVLIDVVAEHVEEARKDDEFAGMDGIAGLFTLGLPDQLLGVLGLKGTRALAGGVYLDTERGPLEMRAVMLHPKLEGLFALFDKAPGGFEPPAFASADCSGAGSLFFKFDQVIPQLRAAMKKLPEHERPMEEEEIAGFEGVAGPVLESMGPQVHFITTLSRPFTAQSSQFVAAIQLRDDIPIRNVLSAFGGQIGLKSRDFEGHLIWDAQMGGPMGPQLAVGLGVGYAFVGQTTGVENAMRQASHPDTSLAKKPEFREAIAGLRPGASSYIYQDSRETFDHMMWTLQNPAEALGFDLAGNEELAEALKAPSWAKSIPATDRWMQILGDSVGEFVITPSGIELVTYYRPGRK